MSVTGSTSEAAKKKGQGRGAAGCVFGVFTVMGLGFCGFFVWPMIQILDASGWTETPCTILRSEVGSHRGSKGGTTYSVDVRYEYFVGDQRYTSDRYKFMSGSSSGYDGKAEIVRRLRKGTRAVCYVNPKNPEEAVIERGFTADLLFIGIPLIFVVIGVLGLWFAVIRTPKFKPPLRVPPAATAGGQVAAVGTAAPKPGAALLKPSTSPGARFGCSLVFALFWNGILSFFIVDMATGWKRGVWDGCATVFMIPFLLVGLGLLGLVFYCFLGLFNPRPRLRMSASAVVLGDSVEVDWDFSGSVNRLKTLRFLIEGREEATYRRGTSTSTDKSVFKSIELAKLTRSKEMRRGKLKVAIPLDTMHSFKSPNNKFIWSFKVQGEIPMWPDIDEEYVFEVLPKPVPGGAA